MKYFLICISLWMLLMHSYAQQLPIPREIQAAYNKETRSMDGNPGAAYWINKAAYQIQFSLDPETRRIEGTERIIYTNNSPDELTELVIRLYQDVLKKGGIRDFQAPAVVIHDGVEINRLSINNTELDLSTVEEGGSFGSYGAPLLRSGTNLIIKLEEALKSGMALTVEVDWAMVIPKGYNMRMGTYGDATFFVAYWYPQIAVYDDIDGWDKHNYTGTQEMYNDFSDYEVEIKVPNNVMVWATGSLQNPSEVLTSAYLRRYEKAQKSREVINIITEEDLQAGVFLQNGAELTWKFKAEQVPDFAFGVSDSFLWDACTVEVAPGQSVLVDAAYKPSSAFYPEACEIAALSVLDLSTNLPGVPYPYPNITVFNGSGGMEFPMIVNDGATHSRTDLIDLTYHEIAHTYFPFYMGINERKYAWMDEGWATILPNDLILELEPEEENPIRFSALGVGYMTGRESDMPLMTLTSFLDGSTYGIHAYSKPALGYHYLRDMMGDSLFQHCMQTYIDRWNGKHPTPFDFFYTFNEASGYSLNWFWQDWFFETNVPDLALIDVEAKGKKVKFKVDKIGGMPVPIHLTYTFSDGSTQTEHLSIYDAHYQYKRQVYFKKKFEKEIFSIELGRYDIPDQNPKDNHWQL